MATLTGTFNFPSHFFGMEELMDIERKLVFKSMGGEKYGFGDAQRVSLMTYKDGVACVPRRFAYEHLPQNLLDNVDVQVAEGDPIVIPFKEEMQNKRPEMKERQDAAMNVFLQMLESQTCPAKGGLFCAPCGSGKTVVGLKMASKLGRTTLVVVHKEFLMTQWKERICQYLDILPEDVGIVQQEKCEFEGKKIVIAMVQSLIGERQYAPEFYDWPGVIIFDEAHRMAAPQFNEAVPKFRAKYLIGLTATPRRSDGLQPVFEWRIGKVLSKIQGGPEVTPKIHQVKFDVYIPDHYYRYKDKMGNDKILLARLVNYLVSIRSRNEWIGKQIVNALEAGRKVMILSDRREHLEELSSLFIAAKTSYSWGYYVGGMKQADRERSAQCDLILATFQMAKEALDIPDCDTLFLTTPKTDVEQSVGRIVRFHADKKPPLVVDIVDSVPVCMEFARKRSRQYRKLKYEIVKEVEK